VRTRSLRGAHLEGLVPAYHTGHAGPRGARHSPRTQRKNLTELVPPTYRSCAIRSLACSGADGTTLTICGTGSAGEDSINSTSCAVTTEDAAYRSQSSIYICRTSVKCPYDNIGQSCRICLAGHQHQPLPQARQRSRISTVRPQERNDLYTVFNVNSEPMLDILAIAKKASILAKIS